MVLGTSCGKSSRSDEVIDLVGSRRSFLDTRAYEYSVIPIKVESRLHSQVSYLAVAMSDSIRACSNEKVVSMECEHAIKALRYQENRWAVVP